MKSILWYQPAKLSEPDVIAYDGHVVSDNHLRSMYFKELKQIANKALKFQRPWCGNVDDYYFVKGSFDAKDERGRQLSFMYVSDVINNNEQLIKDINLLGLSLDKATEECALGSKTPHENFNVATFIKSIFARIWKEILRILNF